MPTRSARFGVPIRAHLLALTNETDGPVFLKCIEAAGVEESLVALESVALDPLWTPSGPPLETPLEALRTSPKELVMGIPFPRGACNVNSQ
eukprot:1195955-Prorocentrum_minimum.AAC.1